MESTVNNTIYESLSDRWYTAQDDPVALLRAEAAHRNPWIAGEIERAHGGRPCRVLDVGCGGGFLANELARRGHDVVGLDAADDALRVAARHDAGGRVAYQRGDALALPYPDGAFDAVCAMDLLEHVEEPARLVAECARVLAPSGLFFFHTFDRNVLSWLVVIKGVEWFVRGTPPDMHVLRLFIRPAELATMCRAAGLEPVTVHGSRPVFDRAFFRLLRTRVVPADFRFRFTRSTRLGYTGCARRVPSTNPSASPAAARG